MPPACNAPTIEQACAQLQDGLAEALEILLFRSREWIKSYQSQSKGVKGCLLKDWASERGRSELYTMANDFLNQYQSWLWPKSDETSRPHHSHLLAAFFYRINTTSRKDLVNDAVASCETKKTSRGKATLNTDGFEEVDPPPSSPFVPCPNWMSLGRHDRKRSISELQENGEHRRTTTDSPIKAYASKSSLPHIRSDKALDRTATNIGIEQDGIAEEASQTSASAGISVSGSQEKRRKTDEHRGETSKTDHQNPNSSGLSPATPNIGWPPPNTNLRYESPSRIVSEVGAMANGAKSCTERPVINKQLPETLNFGFSSFSSLESPSILLGPESNATMPQPSTTQPMLGINHSSLTENEVAGCNVAPVAHMASLTVRRTEPPIEIRNFTAEGTTLTNAPNEISNLKGTQPRAIFAQNEGNSFQAGDSEGQSPLQKPNETSTSADIVDAVFFNEQRRADDLQAEIYAKHTSIAKPYSQEGNDTFRSHSKLHRLSFSESTGAEQVVDKGFSQSIISRNLNMPHLAELFNKDAEAVPSSIITAEIEFMVTTGTTSITHVTLDDGRARHNCLQSVISALSEYFGDSTIEQLIYRLRVSHNQAYQYKVSANDETGFQRMKKSFHAKMMAELQQNEMAAELGQNAKDPQLFLIYIKPVFSEDSAQGKVEYDQSSMGLNVPAFSDGWLP